MGVLRNAGGSGRDAGAVHLAADEGTRAYLLGSGCVVSKIGGGDCLYDCGGCGDVLECASVLVAHQLPGVRAGGRAGFRDVEADTEYDVGKLRPIGIGRSYERGSSLTTVIVPTPKSNLCPGYRHVRLGERRGCSLAY